MGTSSQKSDLLTAIPKKKKTHLMHGTALKLKARGDAKAAKISR